MPLLVEEWTPMGVISMAGIEFFSLALLAGLWLRPPASQWAFRFAAALVFVACAIYVSDTFFFNRDQHQSRSLQPVLGFVVIGLPSLLFALRGRFTFHAEPSPKELAADRSTYEELILQPDWGFYERHLQRPAPTALHELYAEQTLVTAQGLEYTDGLRINTFEPLHESVLLDTREVLGFDIMPFATSDLGDPVYLRPGPSAADTVYLTHHDGGDTVVIAQSVAALVQELGRSQHAPSKTST